jgi:hypothetical protein
MLERAGEEWPRQVDGQELGLRVEVLVTGHGSLRRGLFSYPLPSGRLPLTHRPGLRLGTGQRLRRHARLAKITEDFSYSLFRKLPSTRS